jgi:hypothetical protein
MRCSDLEVIVYSYYYLQFQALREMVHTNPQILQVFYLPLHFMLCFMHLLSKLVADIFATANDPGIGQAESPTS